MRGSSWKTWRARPKLSTDCDSALASCRWRRRAWPAGRSGACSAEKRLAGLDETGNRGAEQKYTTQTGKRILVLLDRPPPGGYAHWSGPLLAAALGDVDVQYDWRFLRAQKIDLAGRKSWCESSDNYWPDAGALALKC